MNTYDTLGSAGVLQVAVQAVQGTPQLAAPGVVLREHRVQGAQRRLGAPLAGGNTALRVDVIQNRPGKRNK